MRWPGPLQERARIAFAAAHEAGATVLESHVVAQAASWPEWHVQTDKQAAAILIKANGKPYHPGSYGRARRCASARGLILGKRVLPNQRLPGLRARSRAGTTKRRVLFGSKKPLGIKDPLSGQELRQRHQQYIEIERQRFAVEHEQLESQSMSIGPRHITTASLDVQRRSSSSSNEFEAMAAQAVRAQQARAARREQQLDVRATSRDQATYETIAQRNRAPPDG
jgi:hypothetical protein